MSYVIKRTDTFVKSAKKFFHKHPQLSDKFKEVLLKIEENPFQSTLKIHKLKGRLKDKYGISLDHKYRIIVIVQLDEKEVILLDIGTHDEIYW